MKSRRIIFLDFDGVLATDRFDEILIGKGTKIYDIFGRKFDPNCASSLKWLIEFAEADIVITSSWRQYLGPLRMRLMWRCREMPSRLRGCTPRIADNRGLEVSKWLSRYSEVEDYVIIDDMDHLQFEPKQQNHLVTCDHFSGFSLDDAKRAVQILISDDKKLIFVEGSFKF